MQAFLDNQQLRESVVESVSGHRLEPGGPWRLHTPGALVHSLQFGCPDDCLLHRGTWAEIEERLGIPISVLCLNEAFQIGFHKENKTEEAAEERWQLRFVESIECGADLGVVVPLFIEFILANGKFGLLSTLRREENQNAVRRLIELLPAHQANSSELRNLRKKLILFNENNLEPGRFSSETDTAIVACDFVFDPSGQLALELLMQAGAQFQYGKKGKSWMFMRRCLRDEIIRLIKSAKTAKTASRKNG